MSDFSIIIRSIVSRPVSTIVTILMVSISVGLLIVLLTLKGSGQQAFARGSGNIDLLLSRDASPMVAVLNAVFHANAPRNSIGWDEYEAYVGSFPWAWTVPIQQGDNYRGHPVIATTTDFYEKFSPVPGEPWSMAQGRWFDKPLEIVLGSEAARRTRLKPGARLMLTHGTHEHGGHVHDEYLFEVVGILEPTGSAHDRAMFTDLIGSWMLHAVDRREAEGIHVTVAPEDLVMEDKLITGILLGLPKRSGRGVSSALQQQFDRLRRDTSITVAQPAAQIDRLFTIVGNLDRIFIAMSIVVLLSSGAAIMLALYNSMDLRRRQIAVLRVLGCSRGRVFSLVLTESAVIGLLGAIGGLVLSVGGGMIAAWMLQQRLGLVIPMNPDPGQILLVVSCTIALAAIAGIVPAVAAYRTDITRNLRPIG
ncbi:MAG: hypothetical protein CMJ32_08870 [Phycisphaerae bacterium]|nr:hypothetical protein [Phycisphaerae bacterium]